MKALLRILLRLLRREPDDRRHVYKLPIIHIRF